MAPQGGCLSIDNFTEAPGRITASGSENDVFEHMFTALYAIGTARCSAAAG